MTSSVVLHFKIVKSDQKVSIAAVQKLLHGLVSDDLFSTDATSQAFCYSVATSMSNVLTCFFSLIFHKICLATPLHYLCISLVRKAFHSESYPRTPTLGNAST